MFGIHLILLPIQYFPYMKDLVSPSEKHINLGMIMVTLENVRKHSYEINISNINLDQNGKLSEKFKRRVGNTLDGLLSFW